MVKISFSYIVPNIRIVYMLSDGFDYLDNDELYLCLGM